MSAIPRVARLNLQVHALAPILCEDQKFCMKPVSFGSFHANIDRFEVIWDTSAFNDPADWPEDGSQPFVWSFGDSTGYGNHADCRDCRLVVRTYANIYQTSLGGKTIRCRRY